MPRQRPNKTQTPANQRQADSARQRSKTSRPTDHPRPTLHYIRTGCSCFFFFFCWYFHKLSVNSTLYVAVRRGILAGVRARAVVPSIRQGGRGRARARESAARARMRTATGSRIGPAGSAGFSRVLDKPSQKTSLSTCGTRLASFFPRNRGLCRAGPAGFRPALAWLWLGFDQAPRNRSSPPRPGWDGWPGPGPGQGGWGEGGWGACPQGPFRGCSNTPLSTLAVFGFSVWVAEGSGFGV